RQAGLVHGILDGAGIYVGEKGKDRSFRALADDDGETVGKPLDGCALLERGQILTEGERAESKTKDKCLYRNQAKLHFASAKQHKNRSYVDAGNIVNVGVFFRCSHSSRSCA